MIIKSDSAQITVGPKSNAYINVNSLYCGQIATLMFAPNVCGYFVLARRKTDELNTFKYLLMAPDASYKAYIEEEGFIIEQVLK